MTTALCFVALAGSGATLRWLAADGWPGGHRGTLAVNVVGAVALGLLGGWTGPALTVVGTGGLGSLTTFSTFAADTTNLADGPGGVAAVRHVAGTLVLGVAAAWLGLAIAG